MISFLITFFVSITTLKFTYEIETSLDLLRSPSVVFGKWSETFAWPSDQFFKCLHGKWSEISWNSPRTSLFIWIFYIINRKLQGCLERRNFSSRVEKYFTHSLWSLVWPRTKLALNWRKPENISLLKKQNTRHNNNNKLQRNKDG